MLRLLVAPVLRVAVLTALLSNASLSQTIDEPVPPDCQDAPAVDGFSWVEIRAVQHMLNQLGRLPTAAGGRLTKETCDAITTYVRSKRIDPVRMTGESLVSSLAAEIDRTGAWRAEAGNDIEDKGVIKKTQRSLQRLGYPIGGTDGELGAKTRTGIALFQKDVGLRVSTRLTRNVYDNIVRAAGFGADRPKGDVRVLNWPDYIDNKNVAEFESAEKLRVIYEVSSSQAETLDYLSKDNSRFDVVVVDLRHLQSTVKAKLLGQLDLEQIPNFQRVGAGTLKLIETQEGQYRYAMPYLAGVIGIGVDEARVRAVSAGINAKSLGMFFDRQTASRLVAGGCQLAVIDEPGNVLAALAAYGRREPLERIEASMLPDLERQFNIVAPYLTPVAADVIIDNMSRGELCAAFMFSGDALLANRGARGLRTIRFHVPEVVGGQLGLDVLVVPQAARNKEGAYRFINFLLEPRVVAANSNNKMFGNGVPESGKDLDPQIRASFDGHTAFIMPSDPQVAAEIDRIWQSAPLRRRSK